MASFNHRVRPITDDDLRDNWRSWQAGLGERCLQGKRKANPGCQEPATFICEYDYVTGRAGRISSSRKARCRKHAAAFASRHGCGGLERK